MNLSILLAKLLVLISLFVSCVGRGVRIDLINLPLKRKTLKTETSLIKALKTEACKPHEISES